MAKKTFSNPFSYSPTACYKLQPNKSWMEFSSLLTVQWTRNNTAIDKDELWKNGHVKFKNYQSNCCFALLKIQFKKRKKRIFRKQFQMTTADKKPVKSRVWSERALNWMKFASAHFMIYLGYFHGFCLQWNNCDIISLGAVNQIDTRTCLSEQCFIQLELYRSSENALTKFNCRSKSIRVRWLWSAFWFCLRSSNKQ